MGGDTLSNMLLLERGVLMLIQLSNTMVIHMLLLMQSSPVLLMVSVRLILVLLTHSNMYPELISGETEIFVHKKKITSVPLKKKKKKKKKMGPKKKKKKKKKK